MPTSSPVEPSLFDFFDDFAAKVSSGAIESWGDVAANSAVITFCEGFFAQFFEGEFGKTITGFGASSKSEAARLALELKRDGSVPRDVIAMVALFESFCDIYPDVLGGSAGAPEITYADFHKRFVTRLLKRAGGWAAACGYSELKQRIEDATTVYHEAKKAMKW